MAKDAVTLVDVAHAAGVSIATASRALTGKNRVSKQTIAHVTSVAAQLGYRVNVFGRALREGTNGTIGVVVPVVGNPFYGQLVHSLEEELQKHGLELVIADSHGEVDREQSRMRMLVDRRVEGIVVVPADAHLSAAALSDTEQSVPVVQLDRRVPGAAADFVGIDNRAAMQAIVAHLVEQGATSIVLVGADDTTSAGTERRLAFEEAVQASALACAEPVLDRFTLEFGEQAAARLVRRGPLPDAVVCGDDLIAAGFVSGLKRAGVRVPEDVLVTGFDGTMLADVCDPRLTTIVQPFAALAAAAVDALVSRGDRSADAPVLSLLAPHLRVAESTSRGVEATTRRRGSAIADPVSTGRGAETATAGARVAEAGRASGVVSGGATPSR